MSFTVQRTGLSGLPLTMVPAVVMDTETTGLKVGEDRVIEIGAVRIIDGTAVREDDFSRLINPQVPIPAASTAIHTITDDDVAGAEPFKPVMAAFSKWCGNSVVLGYSIGFDLGILKAEHERHGLKWNAPRSLDVRHLVQLLAPELPDQSLDMAAGWLGVEIGERHRAVADAELTLQVFQRLIPKLKHKGIVTLSQAERACLLLGSRLTAEAQAGWHDVVRADRTRPAAVSEYMRIDSYPYRHRVREVMHASPQIVEPGMTVSAALAQMMARQTSSVFVKPVEPGGAHGILTERDVLRGVNAQGAGALSKPVGSLAKFPLVSIKQDEFVYRAVTTMTGGGFRHLGVVDEAGVLTGALSARDLLKQRAGGAALLGDSIDQARTPAELGRVWAGLTTVVRGLVSEDVDSRDIASVVSRELRALTARACVLAEEQMQRQGKGVPPQRYAMFVLGSGGRGESLLAMDQDNAIVYEEGEEGDPVDTWFAQLGQIVADTLNDAGVSYCKGNIMASHPAWRKDVARWRDTVSEWLTKSRPDDILDSDIFFDAVGVHGDEAMVKELVSDAITAAGTARDFLRAMGLRTGDFESPVGWLGRFKLDDGRIDLKKCGLLPLFSCARVMALRHGFMVRSTPGRLAAARDLGVEGMHIADDLIEAHRVILDLILRQQLRDIEAGLKLGNKVDPKQLDSFNLQQMRWAIDQVPKVRDVLGLPTFSG
jgi:DNA polymerase-3 subunit epsilon/CBS domain-containing protein